MSVFAAEDSKLLIRGCVDLHVHTSFSDGFYRPREVVSLAVEAGLTHLAVTDHDTVAGLAEAETEADRAGIGFIPGLELSVEYDSQDLHLLAYWIDRSDPGLNELLREVGRLRKQRARQIVASLHRLGVALRYEQVERCADGSMTIGRPHVARALVEDGWVCSIPEAFARYLRVGAPAYVAKGAQDPVKALRILREAGGVPVLAHPGTYRLDGSFRLLLEGGLQGIEAEHPAHTPQQAEAFRRLAKRHGLVATGGSDFHGGEISEFKIGSRSVPVEVLENLAARRG
jgi:predicted metal-dependent phosphoesterase TrpH